MNKLSLLVCPSLALLIAAAPAQGFYKVKPNGLPEMEVYLNTTPHRVSINGVEQPGWTWQVLDVDNDGADDIRVTAPDGGRADLVNGAAGSGSSSGQVLDGNNGGAIGTWSR